MRKEIAAKLGIDESRVSDLLRGKIESFTLDRLICFVAKLNPGMRIQTIAA